jgi:hypothetical protein
MYDEVSGLTEVVVGIKKSDYLMLNANGKNKVEKTAK